MARFFFNFRQGDEFCPDSEGLELATVEQAYLEAYLAAEEMWSELLKKRRDPRRCAFEVHDSSQQLLFVFPFAEVIESCSDYRLAAPIAKTFHDLTKNAARAKRSGEGFREELAQLRKSLLESKTLLAAPIMRQ